MVRACEDNEERDTVNKIYVGRLGGKRKIGRLRKSMRTWRKSSVSWKMEKGSPKMEGNGGKLLDEVKDATGSVVPEGHDRTIYLWIM